MKNILKKQKKLMSNLSENNKNNTITEGNKKPSVILRKCCACGKIVDRNELVRILKEHKTSEIIIEPNNKQFGRSMYLCKSEECLKLALKKKRLKSLSEENLNKLQLLIKGN